VQEYFGELADHAASQLRGDEVFTCSYHSETSDFLRFNHTRVRQAGSVRQSTLSLDLIEGRRHASAELGLAGEREQDLPRLERTIARLREIRAELPEDPMLLYSRDGASTEARSENRLPPTELVLDELRTAGAERDLVGIYAAGGVHSGFANSLGQRNWDERFSFNLDWSCYHDGDKAAKANYAGFDWESREFGRRAERCAEQLRVLSQTPRTIEPGRYRVYLTPAALMEIVDMLAWGGFGLRAHRTKTTPLLQMLEGGERLHPAVSIDENTEEGVAPGFQAAGFMRPPRVSLIREGRLGDTLVSPRSSAEYGVPTNGATSAEAPLSVDFAPGVLSEADVLRELGTGIYVSNLWYLNFSDRNTCRTTGMTRFATFWVENGKIAAPLAVMRFDETLYRMLGDQLAGLTRERELLLDPGSYGRRSQQSARLPGALVDDFTFTL